MVNGRYIGHPGAMVTVLSVALIYLAMKYTKTYLKWTLYQAITGWSTNLLSDPVMNIRVFIPIPFTLNKVENRPSPSANKNTPKCVYYALYA